MIDISPDMPKSKIIHVITRLDMGGSAQNTLYSCIGLDPNRFNTLLVHGLSLESDMTDAEKACVNHRIQRGKSIGVRFVQLPSLVRKIDPISDIRAFLFLARLFLDERPDIVHTHTSKAGALGRLAAWITRVPMIIHTPHGHVFFGHFRKGFSLLFYWAERLLSLLTHHIVALSKGEAEDYTRLRIARLDRLSIIHSGVDIKKFEVSSRPNSEKKNELGLNPAATIIGTAGWLLPIKGPDILLNAMGRVWDSFPNARLVFIGKGFLEPKLRRMASEMGASDKVNFLGWRDDVHEIMPLLDIFVLPSLNEGMGRVIVEAMAAARPVVASRVGGIPDMVIHEQTGLLTPPGDDKALAHAILWMLDHPEKAKEMGKQGRMRCRNFSLESMLEKINLLYLDALEKTHPRSKFTKTKRGAL